MLPEVRVGRRGGAMCANVDHYRLLVGDELIDEIVALAQDLKGIKICHVNSTAFD